MSENKPLDLEKKLNFIFHNIEDELLWRLEKKKLNKTEIRSILKGSKEYLLKEIKQQINEAIQGLIQEVEAKKTELENKKLEYAKKTNDEGMAIIEVLLSLCDWFKEKIKKYFPEEVKK